MVAQLFHLDGNAVLYKYANLVAEDEECQCYGTYLEDSADATVCTC